MQEKTKQYLDSIRNYKGITNAYNEQLLNIRLIGYTAPIQNYNNLGVKSGSFSDAVQDRYILALEECEEKIKDRATEYAKALTKFCEEVETLPNSLYRLVLLLYYGSKKSLKDVAEEIDKSIDRTKHIKQKAIEQFEKYVKVSPNSTF